MWMVFLAVTMVLWWCGSLGTVWTPTFVTKTRNRQFAVMVVAIVLWCSLIFMIITWGADTREECEADPTCAVETTERYVHDPDWFMWPLPATSYKERE